MARDIPSTFRRWSKGSWFDYNKADEQQLMFLQGDRRHAGDPSDGVIGRRQLAQVLVASVSSESALRKTFELVAVKGPAQHNLAPLFAALEADPPGRLDAVRDLANMPLPEEPQRVRDDLQGMKTAKAESAPRADRGAEQGSGDNAS